jgi:uncharacterized protein YutE (UPF0331/DUF86 family)
MSPGKISQKTVTDKANRIRELLAAIGTLPLTTEQDFLANPHLVAAGESYLRRALEALLDLGRHLLAKGAGKAVPEYAAIADELASMGVLAGELAGRLRMMARYRNRMVHFYDEVTPAELYQILTHHLGDFETILGAIFSWLRQNPQRLDTAL